MFFSYRYNPRHATGWILIPNNAFVIPLSRQEMVGVPALPNLCKWQTPSSGEVAAIKSGNFLAVLRSLN